MVGLSVCLTWLVVAVVLRTSSIAALVAATSTPLWMILINDGRFLLLAVVLTVLIYFRHGENLKRIKAGTEPRIGQKNA
jgi:glycerol-3-phosphate acyltransferase PlsY